MGRPRSELQTLLISLLGSTNVYFQPPASLQMKYPCIVYKRDSESTKFADDRPYNRMRRYLVTVIDTNPDSVIHEKVGELPLSSYDRFYTADNLNHDVYRLFF
jgi:hypothetical protein